MTVPQFEGLTGDRVVGINGRQIVSSAAMRMPAFNSTFDWLARPTGATALLNPFRHISLPRKGRRVGLCIVL